jgi:exonuclease VII small subunit
MYLLQNILNNYIMKEPKDFEEGVAMLKEIRDQISKSLNLRETLELYDEGLYVQEYLDKQLEDALRRIKIADAYYN